MPKYQVIVGNVGAVDTPQTYFNAYAEYDAWVKKSVDGEGRAAGESVTLLVDGEIVFEHTPEDES